MQTFEEISSLDISKNGLPFCNISLVTEEVSFRSQPFFGIEKVVLNKILGKSDLISLDYHLKSNIFCDINLTNENDFYYKGTSIAVYSDTNNDYIFQTYEFTFNILNYLETTFDFIYILNIPIPGIVSGIITTSSLENRTLFSWNSLLYAKTYEIEVMEL